MTRFSLTLASALALSACTTATGQHIAVVGPDELVVRNEHKKLAHIDPPPESCPAARNEARIQLQQLKAKWGLDCQREPSGEMWCDAGRANVNYILVNSGLAFADGDKFAEYEASARSVGAGMWGDMCPGVNAN